MTQASGAAGKVRMAIIVKILDYYITAQETTVIGMAIVAFRLTT